jgi:DNA-binding MarR family transcriptional regulator
LGKSVEKFAVENPEITREDLLQKLIEQMFSIMKQVHRDISPPDPLLSPPQARLLFAIAKRNEEGISVKELANKTNVTPGAITQIIDTLVNRDLVRRDEDPNDRRIVRLTLNINAKNQIKKFHKEFFAAISQSFDVLSIEELGQLVYLLSKIGSKSEDTIKV